MSSLDEAKAAAKAAVEAAAAAAGDEPEVIEDAEPASPRPADDTWQTFRGEADFERLFATYPRPQLEVVTDSKGKVIAITVLPGRRAVARRGVISTGNATV